MPSRKLSANNNNDARYTIDVDEIMPKLAKLIELLGSHGDGIALASSLFILDVPVVLFDVKTGSSQPLKRYAYRRGWSHAEMAALVNSTRVLRAVENAKRRRDEARLGLGFSDDSLLETDILPADAPPRLSKDHKRHSKLALETLATSRRLEGEATGWTYHGEKYEQYRTGLLLPRSCGPVC